MNNVYPVITDRIIALLEQGTVPWRKPWNGDASAPRNLISHREYRGINAFLLSCTQYDSPYWLTFKQARQLGGAVRKGASSLPVIFWKWNERTDDESGDTVRTPVLRYYSVFHVSQCDLPADKIPAAPAPATHVFSPIATCQQVVDDMPQPPAIAHGASEAFYRPAEDSVHMPSPERFEQPAAYYATLFHELGHATGHRSRLAREGITQPASFGTSRYSKEELIAEMTAAFLCGHCAIDTLTLENSASYIDSWLGRLRGDARLVVHAAAAAQKAADFILGQLTPRS